MGIRERLGIFTALHSVNGFPDGPTSFRRCCGHSVEGWPYSVEGWPYSVEGWPYSVEVWALFRRGVALFRTGLASFRRPPCTFCTAFSSWEKGGIPYPQCTHSVPEFPGAGLFRKVCAKTNTHSVKGCVTTQTNSVAHHASNTHGRRKGILKVT